MLNLKEVVNNIELVKNKLKTRGFNVNAINVINNLAISRTNLMVELQNLEFNRNKISKEIGIIRNKGGNATDLLKKVVNVKSLIENIKIKEKEVNSKIENKLLYVPNLPLDIVPIGSSENDNVEIKEHILGRGKIKDVIPHYDIGIKKEILDFKRTVKISGSRFWSYKGKGAKLLRAIQSFMLDEHTKNGYLEFIPPLIVNDNIMIGTGQLPKFKDDLFKLEGRKSYLIPTAEVPLTNLYSNEIIDLSKSKMFTAFTPCFRAEAGSGGKDMKGLIRSHQFYKVEVVKITSKEDLEEEFNKTLNDCKNIIKKLELSYREIMLCTADLGFSSERTIDLEIWIPSENRYRETSSVSSFGDFQCRRAKIRYKDKNGNNQYAYTINGSGLAIDRVIATILEIYQNKDGTITIPKVLVPYMGEEKI